MPSSKRQCPAVSEDTGQVPQGETSLELGRFPQGKTSLRPGFPHELSQQPPWSWLGKWHGSGSLRAGGQSGIRRGRQSCALCLRSSLSPAGRPVFRCAAPKCLLFPAGCHREHGASSHRSGLSTSPCTSSKRELPLWSSSWAAEGEKGSVSCAGNVAGL